MTGKQMYYRYLYLIRYSHLLGMQCDSPCIYTHVQIREMPIMWAVKKPCVN